jgi:hypothetical protein
MLILICFILRLDQTSSVFLQVAYCKQKVLERTVLFKYSKLDAYVSWLHYMVTVVKQWVQLWYPLLHKYVFKCHIRMVWLQLPNLTLHGPTLCGANFASNSEV